MVAAWFAPIREFAPGEPITMVDQDRPLISAWASGQKPDTPRFNLGQAERVAGALRRLGELTVRLADARSTDSSAPPGGGYGRAVERLRAVGALAGEDGVSSRLAEQALATALIEAAVDCAADVPVERRRYLLPERRQSTLAAAELRALEGLTLSGPERGPSMLRDVQSEIARREQDLAAHLRFKNGSSTSR
jgi:hypothetical protein